MNKEDLLKAVKTRIKYLQIVGGTDSCSVDTVEDVVLNIHNSSQELMSFQNCKTENIEEFKRLSVELCADLIIMIIRLDDFVTPKMGSEFVIKRPKDFSFGGPILNTPSVHNPMIGQVNAMAKLSEAMSIKIANDIISGEEIRISSDGVIKDIYSKFRDNYSHMIDVVKKLSGGDSACINGLYDIIVYKDRPGIAIEMEKIGLVGRVRCLGFTAKICKCDTSNMDAIINAYKDGALSPSDIITECIERRGKGFSVSYILDNYK